MCETNELLSLDSKTLTNQILGKPLEITITKRLSGAIHSLKWNNKEFVNSYDHGRQIQYAWQVNSFGECLNPTEAGSKSDSVGESSTSRLITACVSNEKIVTKNNPAYWTAPGEGAICANGATTGLNTTLAAEDEFSKEVTIGYEGIENILHFKGNINLKKKAGTLAVAAPVLYLTHEFNTFYTYNPTTGTMVPLDWSNGTQYASDIFAYEQHEPLVVATSDGAYALGIYGKNAHYTALKSPNSDVAKATNSVQVSIYQGASSVKNYTYESFIALGTMQDVQTAISFLFEKVPYDISSYQGQIDEANCKEIFGWAKYPTYSTTPITVDLYTQHPETGEEQFVASQYADLYGLNRFVFSTPQFMRDGKERFIYLKLKKQDSNNEKLYIPIKPVSPFTCSGPQSRRLYFAPYPASYAWSFYSQ